MRRSAAVLSVVALVGAASPAPAEEIPVRVQQVIERLDSDDASVRERATEELQRAVVNRSRLVTPELIGELLRAPALSPEQRTRLILVDRALFEDSPKPGMGVRFVATGPEGVVIDGTVAGFHAADVLRSGDLVLTADGRRLTQQIDLRTAILSHDPGDEVALTVRRGEEVLEVKVELGELTNLGNGGRVPGEYELEQAWAWRARRLRLLGPATEPIDARGAGRRSTRGEVEETTLVAGGAARHVPDPDGLLAADSLRRRQAAALAQTKFVRPQAPNPLLTVRGLVETRDKWLADLDTIARTLGDERIPDTERQKLERSMDLLRTRIAAVNDRIAELQKQIAP